MQPFNVANERYIERRSLYGQQGAKSFFTVTFTLLRLVTPSLRLQGGVLKHALARLVLFPSPSDFFYSLLPSYSRLPSPSLPGA